MGGPAPRQDGGSAPGCGIAGCGSGISKHKRAQATAQHGAFKLVSRNRTDCVGRDNQRDPIPPVIALASDFLVIDYD